VYRAQLDPAQGWKVTRFEPFATGLRNSVALTVLPSGAVLQGENSIDYPDAAQPPEELNRLQAGRHYGWPYCVGKGVAARGYEKRYDCAQSTPPVQIWPAHAAPLHLLQGTAGSPFAGQLLVAWHGYRPTGQRVMRVPIRADGTPTGPPRPVLEGWRRARACARLATPRAWPSTTTAACGWWRTSTARCCWCGLSKRLDRRWISQAKSASSARCTSAFSYQINSNLWLSGDSLFACGTVCSGSAHRPTRQPRQGRLAALAAPPS